jgi:G3E family GTPase
VADLVVEQFNSLVLMCWCVYTATALQVEFADVLLLNKVDLLSEQEQQQLRALLYKLNPSAKVRATRCTEQQEQNGMQECKLHGSTASHPQLCSVQRSCGRGSFSHTWCIANCDSMFLALCGRTVHTNKDHIDSTRSDSVLAHHSMRHGPCRCY